MKTCFELCVMTMVDLGLGEQLNTDDAVDLYYKLRQPIRSYLKVCQEDVLFGGWQLIYMCCKVSLMKNSWNCCEKLTPQ